MSDFDQLFEVAALSLFEDYQSATNMPQFLQQNLPLNYGVTEGVLVNRKKDISSPQYLFYNAQNCPVLPLSKKSTTKIIPVNYAYGNLSFFKELNQETLNQALVKKEEVITVFNKQKTDNQDIVKPLNVWIADDLTSFLSINDLEDRLLAETHPPDLVAIINKGLLVTLNDHTIQQIFALSEKENSQSFDKKIAQDLIGIAQKTMQRKYFKMAATAPYKNLFYTYILLLELLKTQPLLTDDLSAEMVSIWS